MGSAAHADDDLAALSYEEARDELVSIVARLEGGKADLEESMRLWERGERLAQHCTRWLDGAQTRLTATGEPPDLGGAPAPRTARGHRQDGEDAVPDETGDPDAGIT